MYSGKLQVPYDAFAAGLGDHTIVTTLCPGGKERMGRLMRMVATGRFDPTPLITHRFRSTEIGEAYELFATVVTAFSRSPCVPEWPVVDRSCCRRD